MTREEQWLQDRCVCGHTREYHGPSMWNPEHDYSDECHECNCSEFDEAVDTPLGLVPLCLTCRTPMQPIPDTPGMYECGFCAREAVRP